MASYVTLSYCWGAPQPRMLSNSNLDSYVQAIDPGTLPQTIQDAIGVVRELGQRYLWVDSLCIIQDSPEDKAHEISRMGSIYKDSYLTIQAAGAATCGDGFLRRSSLPVEKEFALPYLGTAPGTMILRLWTMKGEYEPSKDPTYSRAWIYQESMLSARLLIYPTSPHPLQWLCATSRKSNGGAAPSGDDSSGNERLELNPTQPQAEDVDASRRQLWYRVVNNYNGRSLGNAADKLPAIAALAEEFERARGPQTTGGYRAGLWMNDMPLELLWRMNFAPGTELVEVESGRPYRAPSWSWASIDYPVTKIMRRPFHTHDFEILSCDVELAVPGVRFGEVRSASLTVRALLKSCTWSRQRRELRDADLVVGQGNPDVPRAHGVGEVWCMPVLRAPHYTQYDSTGLLLEKRHDRYARLGVFILYAHEWFESCGQQTITIV